MLSLQAILDKKLIEIQQVCFENHDHCIVSSKLHVMHVCDIVGSEGYQVRRVALSIEGRAR